MKHLQLKRFTGLLLALIMLLGMVPVSAAPAAADTYVSNVITPIPMDEPEPEEESDPFADLETEEDFLASFRGQQFKGPYNERLVAVAETQLGYTESERNFIYKEENGEKQKMGYTRYGAWYGPGFDYESWCAMFISFCLHYAEVPEELMPRDSGVITWMHTLQRSGLYRERGEYMAKPGDLIFFDWDLDGRGDHVGIVHSTFWQDGVEMVRTIEGNHTRTVEYFTYPRYSYEIMGYGCTPYEDPDAVKALFTTDYLSLDGSTYRVTLTCDSDAGIPKGTQLSVSEVSSDPYLASTAEALGLGEEDILVYTRFFDIKLIKDGVEIEPLTPVQVSVDLLDMETPAGSDGVQVVHFAEDGTKALDGSSEDGSSVTFMADSFSVYGFGVALRPVAKEESSLADVTLYSTSPSSAPSVSQPELDAPVEGLETMSVLTVGSADETGGKTFVRASLKDASALSETESLALYTVESNRVTDVLVDSLSADAKLISLPASTEGVALVKDTGYRRLSFETEEVALTGMMPKASDAQVQDVTSAYAAFQPASDPAEDLSLNPEEVSDPTVLAAYDISISNGTEDYQPDEAHPVTVELSSPAIAEEQAKGVSFAIWHLKDDGTQEQITDFTETEGKLTFTAPGFSVYVVTYTVDFHFGDYDYSMAGESTLLLSELFEHLGITDIDVSRVADVTFSDPTLLAVEKVTDPAQIPEGSVYKEGDWLLISLEPFETEETLTVTLTDGKIITIAVTDAYHGVVVEGTDLTHFAADMDLTGITIRDLSAISADVAYDNSVFNLANVGGTEFIRWNGTLPRADNATTGVKRLGSSITFTYPNGAYDSDNNNCDVVITLSEFKLYGDIRTAVTGDFRLASTSQGINGLPDIATGIDNWLCNVQSVTNPRYGLEARAEVKVVDPATGYVVPESFVVTVWDINNNNETTASFANIWDASAHHNFSEYVRMSGDVYYVGGSDSYLKVVGNDILPKSGNAGNNSYNTGVAAVAQNGSYQFTVFNGGGQPGVNRNFYLMPRHGISHTITSYSGFGGSIETTTPGEFTSGNGSVLPGGTITHPKTYEVPAGKDVTYRFKADDGYTLNKLYVQDGAGSSQDVTGSASLIGPDTDGWYSYTFRSVSNTHKINVSWEPVSDLKLSLGHVGIKTDGSLVDLQSAVDAQHPSHPTEITLTQDAVKTLGQDTQPPATLTVDNAEYKFEFYTLGDEFAVQSGVGFGGNARMQIRYTEDGQYQYSADGGSSWHTWNSAGNGEKPVVYAVYTFAGGENDHYVPVTVMAGTEGLLVDDTAADNVFTYQYTVKEQKWKLEDGTGTMKAVKDGEPTTVFDGVTFTLHPNTINTILLKYTEVKDGGSTSSITTQSVEIVQTGEPFGYAKKTGADFIKHQENGTSTDAGTVEDDETHVKKFVFDTARNGVTVSSGSTAGSYNMAVATPPVGTDVEFYNVRETVKLNIEKILNDPSMAASDTKDFTFTVRLREHHAHGEHVHMMGSYKVTGVKNDGITYTGMMDEAGTSVTSIEVPTGVDVLIIERWNSADDRYDTTVTGASIFREADREYIVENIQTDTMVTYTNTLKPRTVTVVKELVNGDASAVFNFSAIITETVNGSSAPAAGYPVYKDENGDTVSTDNGGIVTFTITGSGEQALKIPLGADVIITETDPNTNTENYNYRVSRKTGSGPYTEITAGEPYAVTLQNITEDQTVTFRNVETTLPVCQVIATDSNETFVSSHSTLKDAFDAIRDDTAHGNNFRIEMLVQRYNFGNALIIVDAPDFANKNITITTAPEGTHPVTGAFAYRGASGTTATIVKDQTVSGSMFNWSNSQSLAFENITFDGGNIFETGVNGGLVNITDGTVSFRDGALAENFVTAGNGGVVYASGCRVDVNSGAELLNNTAAQGSAIASSSASVYLLGGTITGNKATESGAHGAVEDLYVSGGSGIIVSGSPYVLDNTNGDGAKANIILITDNNNELRVVGNLEDDAKLGIYSVYREDSDEVFGMAAESAANNTTAASSHYTGYYHFKNDRADHLLVGMEGTVPGIQWMGAIARVSNDGGNTWTYHDELSSTEWVNESDHHYHGAFDQAKSYTGDVIVELLLESHPKYTIASEQKVTLDKANLSVTLRTTQDHAWNPGVMDGNGFTSTISRGFNGSGTGNTALFYLNNASAKLKTEDITIDGGYASPEKYTGRAVYVNSGDVCFTGGTTVQNFHTKGAGGAVYVSNSGNHTLIDNSSSKDVIFSNCGNEISTSNDDGAAICIQSGNLIINNSGAGTVLFEKITGNKDADGGAIGVNSSNSITLNNLSTGAIRFVDCTACYGGAMETDSGSITLNNTGAGTMEFLRCYTDYGYPGGAIYCGGKFSAVNNGTITFTGTIGTDAEAKTKTTAGGAIYVGSSAADACSITGSGQTSFTNCKANTDGGAIYSCGAVTIDQTGGTSFANCVATGNGGGVYSNGGTTTIAIATFTSCSSGSTSTSTSNGGGGIYGKQLNVSNSTFTDCTAKSWGGAILCNGSNGVMHSITNCTFDGHKDLDGNTVNAAYGGGIGIYDGSLTMTDCNFYDLTASEAGGAVNMGGGGSDALTMEDCTFVGHASLDTDVKNAKKGGAIRINADNGTTFKNVKISGCWTSGDGGGVYAEDKITSTEGTVSFTDCYTTDGNGGGAWFNGAATLDGAVTFEDCYTGGYGGAMYFGAGGTMTGVTVDGHKTLVADTNNAVKGGAIFLANNKTLTVSGGEIKNCSASDTNGGAINVGSSAKVYFEGEAVVYNNKSTKDGSAVQANVVLDQNNNTTINTTESGLGIDAHIGVYVTGNNTNPYNSHGKSTQPFGTAADTSVTGGMKNIDRFTNDRKEALYGVSSGTANDKLIYWSRPICKIIDTNPDGGTQIGTSAQYEHPFFTLNEAVTYARNGFNNDSPMSASNPVKIEMLVDYVIPVDDKVTLDRAGDNIIITTAKTQTAAQAAGESLYFEKTFSTAQGRLTTDSSETAILKRGWNGDAEITGDGATLTALFNLRDTGILKTKNIIFDGTGYDGRSIANREGSLTIGGGTQFRNHIWQTMGANGAAVFSRGDSLIVGDAEDDQVIFTNCHANDWIANGSEKGGGALFVQGNASVTNAVFEDCTYTSDDNVQGARLGGGAICQYEGTTLTVTNVTFRECEVDGTYLRSGGVIYTVASTVTISNSSFYGPGTSVNAAASGGAIYASNGSGSLSIIDSVFEGYKVSDNGGAVYHGGTGNMTITDTRFGALESEALGKSNEQLTKDDVDSNKICQADTDGGAVYSKSKGTINVTRSNFFGSKGTDHGGAIYLGERDATNRKMYFEACAFIGNECTNNYGAAICEEQTNGRTAKSESYINCVFIDQTVKRGGAALLIRPETLTIENCTFIRCNETYAESNYGGAVYILDNGSTEIRNTKFEDCKADNRGLGGAVYNSAAASTTTLENVSITGSTANKGGAVYSAGNLTIKQSGTGTSEISNCSASDTNGAVQVASGKSMTFEGDVVVWDNQSTTVGRQRNVVLDQDRNTCILTTSTGLGSNAKIGVYVTGNESQTNSVFGKHGDYGMPFGTRGTEANTDYTCFINDRLSNGDMLVRGVKGALPCVMYWSPMLTVSKKVTGDMGDKAQEFTFTLSGVTNGEKYQFRLYKSTNGRTYTDITKPEDQGVKTVSDGQITFTLKHYQKIELMNMPQGQLLTLTEVNETDDGIYSVTVTENVTGQSSLEDDAVLPVKNQGSSAQSQPNKVTATFKLLGSAELQVENTLGAVAPTGVRTRGMTYLWIPAVLGLLLSAAVFSRKRKKRGDA